MASLIRRIAEQRIAVRRPRGHRQKVEHRRIRATSVNDVTGVNRVRPRAQQEKNEIALAAKRFGDAGDAPQQGLMLEQRAECYCGGVSNKSSPRTARGRPNEGRPRGWAAPISLSLGHLTSTPYSEVK